MYTLETEWRWNLYKRWSLVGFVGAGEALENYGDIFNDVKVSGGAGFRYFLAKQYGLHAGIDVSRGPEIWAWNIDSKFTFWDASAKPTQCTEGNSDRSMARCSGMRAV